MLRWPDRAEVEAALREWAAGAAGRRPDLERVGFLGSYARGDWGVGSDLDVVLVLRDSPLPFTSRAPQWDLTSLPVPADLLVYTVEEWSDLVSGDSRFSRTAARETVWVFP